MSELPFNSIAPGETGGVPASSPQGNAPHRPVPGQPGSVKIGKGVLSVELPPETVHNIAESAAAVAMHACKAMFEKWKEKHPNATHTPVIYSKCDGHEAGTGHVPNEKPAQGHQK